MALEILLKLECLRFNVEFRKNREWVCLCKWLQKEERPLKDLEDFSR
jgi:hypothetical protein